MDEHLDTSWCPACDKSVRPKRILVLLPQDAPHPAAALRQPQRAPIQPHRPAQRGGRVVRGGALGLVHGTGRVKPGGGIRRDSDDASKQLDAHPQLPPAPPPPSPASPGTAALRLKVREVICQEQTDLYCSDACRRVDLKLPPALRPISTGQPSTAALVSADPLVAPTQRRPSDSSSGTDFSSLFELPPPGSLTEVDEDEVITTPSPQGMCPPVKIHDEPRTRKSVSSDYLPAGSNAQPTDWHQIAYGTVAAPISGPRIPARPPLSATYSEPALLKAPALSPFDRIPRTPCAPTPEKAAQQALLAKMKFVRTPSSTVISARLGRAPSRPASSSASSLPALSSSRSPSGTRSSSSCMDDFSDCESSPERPTFNHRSSFGGFGTSKSTSLPPKRDDPLARAMAAKHKEERRREWETRRANQAERELEESRNLRARGVEPETWQDRVKTEGPTMGRRAAGLSSTASQHSWSYESLPCHIPLYHLPGLNPPKIEMRTEHVQDQRTGKWSKVEIEVEISEQPKRLFLFGGGSNYRSSSLSLSSASRA